MVCGLGVTDLRWHAQLLEDLPTGEVNFWTPSLWKTRLPPGARFGFMLKSPVRKIGGFGHFVEYSELTVNAAWTRWGRANGVSDREEFRSRIMEFLSKSSKNSIISDDPIIGCIVLSDNVFIESSDQFAPEDVGLPFPSQIVKWKRFDSDLNFPLVSSLLSVSDDFQLVDGPVDDWDIVRRRKRFFQPLFRRSVLEAYGGRCAVTKNDCQEVIEAAHIQPFLDVSSHHPQNGIALRQDIHALFDKGLITFEDDGTVVVHSKIKNTVYGNLVGSKACWPLNERLRPSNIALSHHRTKIFFDKVATLI